MTKRFFISIISIISCMMLNAGSGTIEIKDLEHNVMHNGQKCLGIHLKVTTSGYKGDDFKCVAYVEHPKGTGVKDLNDSYCTTDGNVSTSIKINATYENSVWEDLVLYLPNSEIHPMSGKRTYYIQVYLWRNNTAVASSNYATFDMTGSDNSNVNNNYDNNQYNSKIGTVERQDLPNGGFTETRYNEDGTVTITTGIPCMVCSRTGICGICGGRGGIISAGYGNFIFCVACGGTGSCGTCHGSKMSTMTQTYNLNNMGNNGGYYGGNNYSGNGYSGNNYNYDSGGSSSSNKRTCPGCNGTGKGADEITYAPNYTGGDNSEYCSICGKVTSAHSHRQPMCRVCYGKGYVD